jgi:hypothetical protein
MMKASEFEAATANHSASQGKRVVHAKGSRRWRRVPMVDLIVHLSFCVIVP